MHDSNTSTTPAEEKDSGEVTALPVVLRRLGLRLLDMFTSIWTGVTLLTLLFIYSSIGSAGIMYPSGLTRLTHALVRQWRPFEMTEFEWFHWWPFDLLVFLICGTLILTTLRRIPFKRANTGVWLVHSGIVLLMLGCLYYFGSKVEGDTPVIRRRVVIEIPGHKPVNLVALPGNRISIGRGEHRHTFEIASINPNWSIRSGADKDKRAYSVSVRVKTPQQSFARQLLAGYPQYTEDVIPGEGRAIKITGKALVIEEEHLKLSLEYEPQEHYFLKDTWALYLRKAGSKTWSQRPIKNLPRYNDYVSSSADVWDGEAITPDAINLAVPASKKEKDDPLAGNGSEGESETNIRITGYLRYAVMRQRLLPGGERLNPVIDVSIQTPDETQTYRLVAFDPARNFAGGGQIAFHWIDSAERVDDFARVEDARLDIAVPGAGISLTAPVRQPLQQDPKPPFIEIAGSKYAYRVGNLANDLVVRGKSYSVAIVEIRTPEQTFTRWVFDNPTLTTDLSPGSGDHSAGHLFGKEGENDRFLDAGIVMSYRKPTRPATPVTLLAGPDGVGIHLLVDAGGDIRRYSLKPNEPVSLAADVSLTVTRLMPYARVDVRPGIIPPAQRDRDLDVLNSMIQVSVDQGGQTVSHWLPFNQFVLADAQYAYEGRWRYTPVSFWLRDGRGNGNGNGKGTETETEIEMMFSRQRLRLPQPVVLDDFLLKTHVGGFSGSTSSIRDWISHLRFKTGDGWGEVLQLRTNAPVEAGGLWYFQASWDPPQMDAAASGGLNYTGLGVGNRNGVWIMLFGCCVAVSGMIFAFFIKPRKAKRRESSSTKALADVTAAPEKLETEADVREDRLRERVGLTLAGALVLFAIGYGLSGRSGRPVPLAPSPFATEVDLSPLNDVAIHANGRLKSFASFASSMMQQIGGSHPIAGQAPAVSYFELMLRPEAYEDAPIIYVKNKDIRLMIRKQLASDEKSEAPATEAPGLERFMKTGLIAPRLLQDARVQALLGQLRSDLIRTARHVNEIMQKLYMVSPRSGFLADALRIVPPPGSDLNAPWHSASVLVLGGHGGRAAPLAQLDSQLRRELQEQWQAFVDAWRGQDASGVNAAAARLGELLPAINPTIYPPRGRLSWESWYFRHGSLTWIWLVYMAGIVALLLALVYRWPAARWLGLGVFLLAFGLHTFALALRWHVAGRWPNTNMFEAITTAAWFGGCCALLLEWLARRGPLRNLFALCSSAASMSALMAVHAYPVNLSPGIENRMPILHNVWLYIHTNVIIFSYCLIAMAAVSATLYLLYRAFGGAAVYARAGGAGSLMHSGQESSRSGVSLGQVFDGVTLVLMQFSFVLLWTGIVMGAIWADHSWGRPWGWDPKEVFALNTFIVFVVLVHVRMKVRDKGFWTAVLAVVGCGVMLFNWIIINFVISGLHSYA